MDILNIGETCDNNITIVSSSLSITATPSYSSAIIKSGFCCEDCKTPFVISDIHEGDSQAYVYLDMADGTVIKDPVSLNTAIVYNNYAAIDLPPLVSGDKFRVSVNSAKCTAKSKWATVKEPCEECECSATQPCDIRVKSIEIGGDHVNGYSIRSVEALASSTVQYRLNGGAWVSSIRDIPSFDGYDGNYLEVRGKLCPTKVVKFYIDSLDTEDISPLVPTDYIPVAPTISVSTTQVSGYELATLSGICPIGTIRWSNGSTESSIMVGAGNYSATCVNINGESPSSPEVSITTTENVVTPSAPVLSTNTLSVFGTDKATISGSCDTGTLVWSNGETTPSIHVGVGTYSATCVFGSVSSPSATPISIIESSTPPQIPSPPAISASATQVSGGSLVTISGSCPIGSILWSTGATSNSIMVGAGTYTATCVNSAGSSGNSTPVTISNIATPALFSLRATDTCGELILDLSYTASPIDVQVRRFGSLNVVYNGNNWTTGSSATMFGLQPSEYVVYYKSAGAASSAYVASESVDLSC